MNIESIGNDESDWLNSLRVGDPQNDLEERISTLRERSLKPASLTHWDEAQPPISTSFTIPGKTIGPLYIGWINGIDNTFKEAKEHAVYLQQLAQGHTISGVYNCTHTRLVDLLETALLNHHGYSIITGELLTKQWSAFHEANQHRPNGKLLQICHSQGTIHVKNALEKAPPEIRDRVIVVAIAPAAIVPKQLCFQSFNYSSENDIVYKFEPSALNRSELILLPPHPSVKGIDHAFQSPTYREALQKKLEEYQQRGGEYSPGLKE